ncbi:MULTISPECIES: DUF6095 family protein [Bizionia]|uniref:Uncharacterized protein n=1 Tax=Bizionia algoritergicola TaxID=291187 RepID=A0A5D0QTB3_9FLAO|nr:MULTISPECIES: DUF6095 family protein [Bizionia]OBX22754.1 hypothetical protein BAA08_06885 [Bizionia sp. APA-3]TYB72473.1 hypothetical protein ES675_11995 [Bizionia algoritergicola]
METETKHTDKDVLLKGIKKMGLSLVCMFLGPTLLYIAFSNQEKILYIPLLIVGIVVCGLAIFLAFKGLKTIMDSMFN